jgi:hypothetical protein
MLLICTSVVYILHLISSLRLLFSHISEQLIIAASQCMHNFNPQDISQLFLTEIFTLSHQRKRGISFSKITIEISSKVFSNFTAILDAQRQKKMMSNCHKYSQI